MSAPLKILLADDQIPWPTDAENERTKAEIRREFAAAKPNVDVDRAFPHDFGWFRGLLKYLEQTKGERVIRARTFSEAQQHIDNPRDLDVAIVDLSWWGDYTLPPGESERHNRGLTLLPDAGDVARMKIPIVSLSQNFSEDFELMGTVLERGALPIPKNYDAPDLNYRALYAAVQYLMKGRSVSSEIELFVSHAHADEKLAELLVTAIEVGFDVPHAAIRCTSAAGYGFPPGTDFIQALSRELTGAKCVVGLWTPSSAKSQWCLFELGAAWGLARKTLFLTLGGEAFRDAPAGFRAIQVSQLSDAGQLRTFLDQLGKTTGWALKNSDAANAKVEELAKAAKRSLASKR